MGQEDHVSMGSIAGLKLVEVVQNIHSILGIELMTASQAIDFRRPRKSSLELENIHTEFRKFVPYLSEDVVLHDFMVISEKFIS